MLFLLTLLVVHVETHSQTHKAQSEAQSSKPTLPIAASVVPKQNNGQTLQPKNDDHVDADIRIISAPPGTFTTVLVSGSALCSSPLALRGSLWPSALCAPLAGRLNS